MKAFLKGIPVVKGSKTSKDGNTIYYSIGIAQDGELIEFPTVQAVHDSVKLYMPANFELTLVKSEFQGKVYERKQITALLASK